MNTSTLCELQCSDFEECGTGTSGFWGRTLPLCVNISAHFWKCGTTLCELQCSDFWGCGTGTSNFWGGTLFLCVNFSTQILGNVGQEPPISEEVHFLSVWTSVLRFWGMWDRNLRFLRRYTSSLCELQYSDFGECGTGTSDFWDPECTVPPCGGLNLSSAHPKQVPWDVAISGACLPCPPPFLLHLVTLA